MAKKPHLNLIMAGHVDHGKSTLLGRLFIDKGVVSEQKYKKLKEEAKRKGKNTFDLAYAVDLTEEERERGLTIDLAHKKFETDGYFFTVIDAPGHSDFVKNMITGASQADAAVLVVDVKDGVMPQTREHSYLCKVMGIDQLVVAINKMDLVDYEQSRFEEVKGNVKEMLKKVGFDISRILFVPTSATEGDNVVETTGKMDWYDGPTFDKALDNFEVPERPIDKPLRIPVQDVYTIKGVGTVPVGRVKSGILKEGDKVTIQPAGVSGKVKTIEQHHEEMDEAEPGDNIGFNIRGVGKKDVRRGDVVGHSKNPPKKVKKFTGQIMVWGHPTVIPAGYTPVFHVHTAQVPVKFVELKKKLDPKTGAVEEENPDTLQNGDAAIVEFEPKKPLVIESKSENPEMASFAIRDMGKTVAAGVCIDAEYE